MFSNVIWILSNNIALNMGVILVSITTIIIFESSFIVVQTLLAGPLTKTPTDTIKIQYDFIIDYVTGVMRAILDKKLSSSLGFKCIFKKVLIFVLVGTSTNELLFNWRSIMAKSSDLDYVIVHEKILTLDL